MTERVTASNIQSLLNTKINSWADAVAAVHREFEDDNGKDAVGCNKTAINIMTGFYARHPKEAEAVLKGISDSEMNINNLPGVQDQDIGAVLVAKAKLTKNGVKTSDIPKDKALEEACNVYRDATKSKSCPVR